VLSLLQPEEATALHLQTEAQSCTAHDIEFDNFPIPDFAVPPIDALTNLINRYHQHLHNGANTVVHCRGGIGRTGTICCCLLIKDGMNVTQAIDLVKEQRGVSVPETAEQIAVIIRFASGCHG
jgi:ADP-ribosyl-[dinitrogen reductase] hydrolase